ncbi:MAG: hypothetical protein ACR2OO_09105 [Thermomicrobiales bacterium]
MAHPLNVVMIPSVSGGLGHVARSLKLARALERADPSLRISYALDELNLRPINAEAVARTGYPYRIVPNPVRHERDDAIREVLGDADVVIDDTNRRFIPYRRILPRLRTWISVPMPPLWDELFMDGPLLERVDHILYTYPPIMPVPEELDRFRDKLTVTGPLVDDDMPSRAEARRRLALDPDGTCITYAPRGFPFGPWFGLRVLNGVVGGFIRMRRRDPDLTLNLLAVPDPKAVQPRGVPPLASIDGVVLHGVVSPETARDHTAAADLAVVEATTSLFDAAVARTPVVMVPGLIYETWLEGTWVNECGAGVVMRPEEVTHLSMERSMRKALTPSAAAIRTARLAELVGSGGADCAAQAVLRVIAETVGGRSVLAR